MNIAQYRERIFHWPINKWKEILAQHDNIRVKEKRG